MSTTTKTIDYDRMNRVLPSQKAALTRAVKSGDPEKVKAACKAAIAEWNQCGAWPDCWNRWQIALNDSLPWNEGMELSDL